DSARAARSGSASGFVLHHDGLAAALAHALLGVLFDAVRDARRLAAVRAHHHHLAERERHRLLDDAALAVLGRVRLGVTLRHVHAGHDHARARPVHFLHAAALAAVLARDDLDLVALADLETGSH